MKKILILLLLVLLASGCKDTPDPTATNEGGQANDYYSFSGYVLRWSDGKNITILLPADSDVSVTNYDATDRVAFLAGLAQWDVTLAEIGLSYTVVTSGTADITVNWASILSSGAIGTAYSSGRMDMATTYPWGSSIGAAVVENTAAHELGHLLGIWSHSYDKADLMFPYALGESLKGRDKAVAKWVYSKSPDYTLDSTAYGEQPPVELRCDFKEEPN